MNDTNTRKCWICDTDPADSGEHIIKASTLKLVMGKDYKKFYKTGANEKNTIVQSIKSNHLKFKKSICKTCNNASTSSYDRAHDTLIHYIITNISTLNPNQSIQISDVFSDNNSVKNCYRYFVKIFGCALCDIGAEIPNDLIQCAP